jgi:hypothetical protein
VSDQNSRFTSAFWSSLVEALDIRLKISSPFHPQTDGQTEQVNHMLEWYLRNYCNYEQDHWTEMLPMAEYDYNNSRTTATEMSPFFTNFGFAPWTNWIIKAKAMYPASRKYIHWMTSMHALCHKGLEYAWVTMGKYYDRHAKNPPKYLVGNLVMLNGKNLKAQRLSRKLDELLYGPFNVSKVLSPTANKFELPNRWRIHNTFSCITHRTISTCHQTYKISTWACFCH